MCVYECERGCGVSGRSSGSVKGREKGTERSESTRTLSLFLMGQTAVP